MGRTDTSASRACVVATASTRALSGSVMAPSMSVRCVVGPHEWWMWETAPVSVSCAVGPHEWWIWKKAPVSDAVLTRGGTAVRVDSTKGTTASDILDPEFVRACFDSAGFVPRCQDGRSMDRGCRENNTASDKGEPTLYHGPGLRP